MLNISMESFPFWCYCVHKHYRYSINAMTFSIYSMSDVTTIPLLWPNKVTNHSKSLMLWLPVVFCS